MFTVLVFIPPLAAQVGHGLGIRAIAWLFLPVISVYRFGPFFNKGLEF
jgi:hypothetical protein